MKEDGKTTASTAKGHIGLLTVAGIKASGGIIRKTVEECFFTQMETLSKVSSLMALSMGKEFTNTLLEIYMKANTSTI